MRMAGKRKRPSVVVRFSRAVGEGGGGGGGIQKKDGLRLLHCDKSEFSMTTNMTRGTQRQFSGKYVRKMI